MKRSDPGDFGAYLVQLRQALGPDWSSQRVADAAGVSLNALRNGEVGRRIPSPDVLARLAPVLRVPHEALMQRAGYLAPRDELTLDNWSTLRDAVHRQPWPPQVQQAFLQLAATFSFETWQRIYHEGIDAANSGQLLAVSQGPRTDRLADETALAVVEQVVKHTVFAGT